MKKIVKISINIHMCTGIWNSNKEDTPYTTKRAATSFHVSLNDVIDDYLDELEEGEERDPLQSLS